MWTSDAGRTWKALRLPGRRVKIGKRRRHVPFPVADLEMVSAASG